VTSKRATLLSLTCVVLTLAAMACKQPPADESPPVRFLGATQSAQFARAFEPRGFVLPEDLGPHFSFQTEWWYTTGQLIGDDGHRYGFQLTFFRRGLTPGAPPERPGLATNQIYFAHLALTDVSSRRHAAFERFSRGSGELSGAERAPFRVWLDDWEIVALQDDSRVFRLTARDADISLELELEALKPVVAHGHDGLSAKSGEPGNASYYLSFTRMAAQGALSIAGRSAEVTGEAWFDHEWSTDALGADSVGWDWFSLQLDDGRELMYFQMRREDDAPEPASSGTLVHADGSIRRLSSRDVALAAAEHWTSPHSGARYPSAWRLTVPSAGVDLIVTPLVADQELRLSFTYWEGAVDARMPGGLEPIGRGYAELTGYASSMEGVF